MKTSGAVTTFIFSLTISTSAFASRGAEPAIPRSPEAKDYPNLDSDSEPLFELTPTEKIFSSRIETVSRLSNAEVQRMLQNFQISENGYVWIRLYLGLHGSKKFPNHRFGIKEEFATVTWIKNGKIEEWDAFKISSGYPHSDGGAWSPSGNFGIGATYGAGYKSSSFPRRKSGKHGGAPMPYAMEVNGGIKMHVGVVTGYPVSHGCFRIPSAKGSFVSQIVRNIKKENVLITSYRGKDALDDSEHTANQIRTRLDNPKTSKNLSFYGYK